MSDEEILAWAATQRLMGNLYTGAEFDQARAQGCETRIACLMLRLAEPFESANGLDYPWVTIDTDDELRQVAAGQLDDWLVQPTKPGDPQTLVARLAGKGLMAPPPHFLGGP